METVMWQRCMNLSVNNTKGNKNLLSGSIGTAVAKYVAVDDIENAIRCCGETDRGSGKMVAQLNYFGTSVKAAADSEYTMLDHTTKSEEAMNFEQQLLARVVG